MVSETGNPAKIKGINEHFKRHCEEVYHEDHEEGTKTTYNCSCGFVSVDNRRDKTVVDGCGF